MARRTVVFGVWMLGLLGCGERRDPEHLGSSAQRLLDDPAKAYGALIKYPQGVGSSVKAAAQDMAVVLCKITGNPDCSLVVVDATTSQAGPFQVKAVSATAADDGTSGIYLVDPALWQGVMPAVVQSHLTALSTAPGSAYARYSDGVSSLWIVGKANGVRNGLYAYLRQLGCRWLLPGSNWEILPSKSDVRLSLNDLQLPQFPSVTLAGTGATLQARHNSIGNALAPAPAPFPDLKDADQWNAWIRRNSFPATDGPPSQGAYEAFIRANLAAVSANPRALAADSNDNFGELPDPLPPSSYLNEWLHFTGHDYFEDAGGNIYETPNDYSSLNATDLTLVPKRHQGILSLFTNHVKGQINSGQTRPSVEAPDGAGTCDCSKCRALLHNLDYHTLTFPSGERADATVPALTSSVSDRLFHLANVVAQSIENDPAIAAAHPGSGVAVGAYNDHAAPPHIPIRHNVKVWVNEHNYHQYSGLSAAGTLRAWQAKQLSDVDANGRTFSLATYQQYASNYDEIVLTTTNMEQNLRPWLTSVGGTSVGLQLSYGAAATGPLGQLTAQMAWNGQRTASAMLDDFVSDAFDCAAPPCPTGQHGPAFAAVRPIYRFLFEGGFVNDSLGLAKLFEALAAAQPTLAAVGTPAQRKRFADLESYAHYLKLVNEDGAKTLCNDVDELLSWVWCIEPNLMVSTARVHELTFGKLTDGTTCNKWNWESATASGFSQAASCDLYGSIDSLIQQDAAEYSLPYREVTYARTDSDYMVLPDNPSDPLVLAGSPPNPVNLLPNPPIAFTPAMDGGRVMFSVPATQSVQLRVCVHSTPASDTSRTLPVDVFNAAGTLIKSTLANANPTPVNACPESSAYEQTVISLGTLQAGNYTAWLAPPRGDWTWFVKTTPSLAQAFRGPIQLYQTPTMPWLYFYVPAEVHTAFLRGVKASTLQLYGPNGQAVTSTAVMGDTTVQRFDTSSKPGIWAAHFKPTSEGAQLVNLPNLFSMDKHAVIASKRIRTQMQPLVPGASPVAVTSPTFKYNNRFAFQVTADIPNPDFLVNAGTSIGSPPDIVVNVYDSTGAEVAPSPFYIHPGQGPQHVVSNQALRAGDYELWVTNPSIYNGYAITVPAHVPFVSVDGYGVGNVNLPSYRAFYTLPANTAYAAFAAQPTGSTGIVSYSYDAQGNMVSSAWSAEAQGNNVYLIGGTSASSDTLFAENLKGNYWSAIRLLNAPQIMSFNRNLHMVVAPGP